MLLSIHIQILINMNKVSFLTHKYLIRLHNCNLSCNIRYYGTYNTTTT